MVSERTTTSDPIAYVAKWDSLIAFVVSVFQDLKYVSSDFANYTSQRHALQETNLEFMADKQKEMDDRMKAMDVR